MAIALNQLKKACVTCHEDKYGRYVDEFQMSLNKSVEKLKKLLSEIKTNAKNSVNIENIKIEIEDNEKKLDFIEKAKGVHNMKYTLLLINNIEKRLRNLHITALKR